MHPLLVKIGPLSIHTYGFMIALGFIAAMQTIKRLSTRNGLDPEKMLDMTFWSLLIGFVGARILYVWTRLDSFLLDPLSIFRVWEGGLVFYGGPIAVVPFILWFTRKHKLPLWNVLDASGPTLTIGHMFGRFGCLGAGCCYGKPTGSDWGIRLDSDLVDYTLRGIPLHPTQLYEALGLLLLFVGLIVVERRKAFAGQVALTYFMVYPVLRSIVEIYRGDLIRGFVIDDVLSTSQFISILVFLAALVVLIIRVRTVQQGVPEARK